jgi:homoserine O-acetyltransferase
MPRRHIPQECLQSKGAIMSISRKFLPAFLAGMISLTILTPARAAEGDQQFANLGECKLENGEVIKDCRIGYRTRGVLNADKSNAVVVLLPMPVWLNRTNSKTTINSEGAWIDPSKHFVVVIDTIGNKVSIGPDNSQAQPGQQFPKASLRDMVEINRRLLKEELKLNKVYAIMGEQLGGMQALQWMIAYPDEMEKVIAITTTPKTDAWDYLAWQAMANTLNKPRTTREDFVWATIAAGNLYGLILYGPPQRANAYSEKWDGFGGARYMLDDALITPMRVGLDALGLYARAIVNHDAYKGYGDTAQKAAARAKAKLLTFVLPDDQFTSPAPMLELAKLMDARVVELNNNLSVENIRSDYPLLQKEIQAFLTK